MGQSLDHPDDMESIAAKAIRDGVIDASIDHNTGVLISCGAHDTYSTLEPQAAFHKRIVFCLNLHNDAVKAMTYPPDAHKVRTDPLLLFERTVCGPRECREFRMIYSATHSASMFHGPLAPP